MAKDFKYFLRDPYPRIQNLDDSEQANLARELEYVGQDANLGKLLEKQIISFAANKGALRILEIGCGTGFAAKKISRLDGLGELVCTDPSSILLEVARNLVICDDRTKFIEADACNLPFGSEEFDVFFSHRALCHVPDAQKALEEAWRVLKPGGLLNLLEPDWASLSFSIGANDPLEIVAEATQRANSDEPWICRNFPVWVRHNSFIEIRVEWEVISADEDPLYLMSLFESGIVEITKRGCGGSSLSEGYRDELRKRMAYGISHASLRFLHLRAKKPGIELGAGI